MISTRRFVLLWVAVSLPLPLAQRLIGNMVTSPTAPGTTVMFVGMNGLVLVGSAFLQGWLMRRHRRPVRYWVTAALVGWFLSLLASTSLSLQLMHRIFQARGTSMPEWLMPAFTAVSTTSAALCLAVAQAAVLWGRQRLHAWAIWLSGHLGLRLGVWLALKALATAGPAPAGVGLAAFLLSRALLAAGTAWMLDRLAFQRGSGEAGPS